MTEYGSIEQAKRRRKKHGGIVTSVDCGCRQPPLGRCAHREAWRQRNIKLLGIRKPHTVPISRRETVQREVDR